MLGPFEWAGLVLVLSVNIDINLYINGYSLLASDNTAEHWGPRDGAAELIQFLSFIHHPRHDPEVPACELLIVVLADLCPL